MADVAEKVLQETVENATETLSGAKSPATPEGAAVAYGSLIIMAMLPIFFGALRSVKHQKDQKVIKFVKVTHVSRVSWQISFVFYFEETIFFLICQDYNYD